MSTWGWSGTRQLTLDALSPVTTPTHRISVPAQVRRCLTLHGNTALRNLRWHRENADLFSQQDFFFFCRFEEVELPEFL